MLNSTYETLAVRVVFGPGSLFDLAENLGAKTALKDIGMRAEDLDEAADLAACWRMHTTATGRARRACSSPQENRYMTDQTTTLQGTPVYRLGPPPEEAAVAMIVIHGRGTAPDDIQSLAHKIDVPGVAYLTPEITSGVLGDEHWLSSALAAVGDVLDMVAAAGIPAERTLLFGFSQGACLVLEFAARNPRRYGGVAGLSGTLVENGDTPRDYGDSGSFDGTPVFLGCSDDDPYVPASRLERTAGLLTGLGAEVTVRIYPGMGHTINPGELEFVRNIVTTVLAGRKHT